MKIAFGKGESPYAVDVMMVHPRWRGRLKIGRLFDAGHYGEPRYRCEGTALRAVFEHRGIWPRATAVDSLAAMKREVVRISRPVEWFHIAEALPPATAGGAE